MYMKKNPGRKNMEKRGFAAIWLVITSEIKHKRHNPEKIYFNPLINNVSESSTNTVRF